MAMVVRVSKGQRDYVLKTDRPEYWQDRIEKIVAEIKGLPNGEAMLKKAEADENALLLGAAEELIDKIDEFRDLKKAAQKTSENHKKRGGPTIWKLISIDKENLKINTAKLDIKLGKLGRNRNQFTSGQLSHLGLQNIVAVRMGLVGVENLYNEKNEVIKFSDAIKEDIINSLDDVSMADLAGEILGVVEEEDEGN
jgi:hypothetical protein